MSSSVGMMTFSIYHGKIRFMFQTTNQLCNAAMSRSTNRVSSIPSSPFRHCRHGLNGLLDSVYQIIYDYIYISMMEIPLPGHFARGYMKIPHAQLWHLPVKEGAQFGCPWQNLTTYWAPKMGDISTREMVVKRMISHEILVFSEHVQRPRNSVQRPRYVRKLQETLAKSCQWWVHDESVLL
jgi:hypothetical protein